MLLAERKCREYSCSVSSMCVVCYMSAFGTVLFVRYFFLLTCQPGTAVVDTP
jgi:hypothetical protein